MVGLHVVDIVSIEGSFFHDISGSLGFEPYLDFSSKMRDVLHERGKASAAGVHRPRRRERRAAPTRCSAMGIVANEIAEQARTADLVVIGHRGVNEKFSTGLLGSTAESVTRKCPKPVFVSPLEFRECTRPLLAYDGSQRAAAAMHAAAEFCATPVGLPLTVLHGQQGRQPRPRACSTRRDVPAILRAHAPSSSCSRPATRRERIIATSSRSGDHDLLFIGAYGHSRIIEMVLGSTTEYVLRNAPPRLPLPLAAGC